MIDENVDALLKLLDLIYSPPIRKLRLDNSTAPRGPPIRTISLSQTALTDASMKKLCMKLSSLKPRDDIPLEILDLHLVF